MTQRKHVVTSLPSSRMRPKRHEPRPQPQPRKRPALPCPVPTDTADATTSNSPPITCTTHSGAHYVWEPSDGGWTPSDDGDGG